MFLLKVNKSESDNKQQATSGKCLGLVKVLFHYGNVFFILC